MPACTMAAAVRVKQARASSVHCDGKDCVWAKISWPGYVAGAAIIGSESRQRPQSLGAKPFISHASSGTKWNGSDINLTIPYGTSLYHSRPHAALVAAYPSDFNLIHHRSHFEQH